MALLHSPKLCEGFSSFDFHQLFFLFEDMSESCGCGAKLEAWSLLQLSLFFTPLVVVCCVLRWEEELQLFLSSTFDFYIRLFLHSILHSIYIRFTFALHSIYIRFTFELHSIYIRFTFDLHSIYIRELIRDSSTFVVSFGWLVGAKGTRIKSPWNPKMRVKISALVAEPPMKSQHLNRVNPGVTDGPDGSGLSTLYLTTLYTNVNPLDVNSPSFSQFDSGLFEQVINVVTPVSQSTVQTKTPSNCRFILLHDCDARCWTLS